MANKMPFQAAAVWGAAGSAFGSTIQITVPASQPVYLATSSQTILQGVLPSWAIVNLSATGSQNVAFQVNPDAVGTTWTTLYNAGGSAFLMYLDGTAGQRLLNSNAIPVAAQITVIKQ